ncbi:MAG TPA: hypothetical protein VGI81_02625 [Tepidisphaeraceae bacterium]|jgi:lysylphosphatidylglycerol synthetase-like protein (DUF2156 family)
MVAGTLLGRAESVDPTLGSLVTVLTCAGIVLGVAVAASIPVMIAWSRRHRRADWVITLAILWGVLTVVSVASFVLKEMKYSHEHVLAIESGYFDPNDVSDAPPPPLTMWAILGVGYLALLAWPLLRRPATVIGDGPG